MGEQGRGREDTKAASQRDQKRSPYLRGTPEGGARACPVLLGSGACRPAERNCHLPGLEGRARWREMTGKVSGRQGKGRRWGLPAHAAQFAWAAGPGSGIGGIVWGRAARAGWFYDAERCLALGLDIREGSRDTSTRPLNIQPEYLAPKSSASKHP
jgi:hypothetical protein